MHGFIDLCMHSRFIPRLSPRPLAALLPYPAHSDCLSDESDLCPLAFIPLFSHYPICSVQHTVHAAPHMTLPRPRPGDACMTGCHMMSPLFLCMPSAAHIGTCGRGGEADRGKEAGKALFRETDRQISIYPSRGLTIHTRGHARRESASVTARPDGTLLDQGQHTRGAQWGIVQRS
jgi:hypothetical protein